MHKAVVQVAGDTASYSLRQEISKSHILITKHWEEIPQPPPLSAASLTQSPSVHPNLDDRNGFHRCIPPAFGGSEISLFMGLTLVRCHTLSCSFH